jgi:hypothetical protein
MFLGLCWVRKEYTWYENAGDLHRNDGGSNAMDLRAEFAFSESTLEFEIYLDIRVLDKLILMLHKPPSQPGLLRHANDTNEKSRLAYKSESIIYPCS